MWQETGVKLDEACLLPNLQGLDGEDDSWCRLSAAWSQQGLVLQTQVIGKKQPPWCRESRLEESDGVEIWLDTRATLNVHRATRYCHRFIFLPLGSGKQMDQPVADQLLIQRARENARPVRPKQLGAACRITKEGYVMSIRIPSDALTGYDPQEHPKLGFAILVRDRELGLHTLGVGKPFPFWEDPSLWSTLELVRS
jgi:hypothetical protein